MNSVHLLKNVKKFSRLFFPRFYHLGAKQYLAHPKYASSSNLRYISNYSSLHTDKNEAVKTQKILEDEEFRNILKDFANDFGVDKETTELLEDIRKNIDEEYKESSTNSKETSSNSNNVPSPKTLGAGLDYKYKEFSDADSTVIPSYEDSNEPEEEIYHIDQDFKPKPFSCIKRGVTGVFDIGDFIEILRKESLFDISTISMLTDDKNCSSDFFVLVTARSARHMEAVAESILKLYKKVKHDQDPFLTLQGADNSGWKVIDMGNITLHIFLEEIRAKYDIESCQLFDLEYDSGGQLEADPMLNIIEEQMEFFNSLKKDTNSSEQSTKDIS